MRHNMIQKEDKLEDLLSVYFSLCLWMSNIIYFSLYLWTHVGDCYVYEVMRSL